MLAKRNKGRAHAAGWIGDAIYGVNDGLGSIFGIVSGVSGATLGNSKWVLLSGLAGMIASALSMGSGAYLASKSEREIYEAELAREREAIAMNGAEARELLSLYYQVKGLPQQDADHMVEHIASDPEQMLRALAAERLNSTEEALSNPSLRRFRARFRPRPEPSSPSCRFSSSAVTEPSSSPQWYRWWRISPWARPSHWSPSVPGGAAAWR